MTQGPPDQGQGEVGIWALSIEIMLVSIDMARGRVDFDERGVRVIMAKGQGM